MTEHDERHEDRFENRFENRFEDRLEDRMKKLLHRSDCASTTELGEYHLGLLSGEQEQKIRLHLRECPHCTSELNGLKAFLEEVGPDLEYTLSEKIRIWIAERLPDRSAFGQAAPAFAVRGQDKGPQIYRAGEAELTLEFEAGPGESGRGSLLGLVSGIDPNGVEALLWQDGQLVTSTALDELGNFILTQVETGRYQLIISGQDFEIHIEELKA